MKNSEESAAQSETMSLYRRLPSLDELLSGHSFAALLQTESRSVVVRAARAVLSQTRQAIAEGNHTEASLDSHLASLVDAVVREVAVKARYSLRRVINATGVVLHTNLGRAPLSGSALSHIVEVASGYSNLELDLETGERSRRDVHAEGLLLRLLRDMTGGNGGTGNRGVAGSALAAIVVNNCAAATFLALNSIAEGGEVIVSRGELVEIGGGFRIPEILAKSGAVLREVGTTNRTRVSDYESAITPATRLILRVHPSNFSMEGFTERPALEDLVLLAKRRKVPVFDDQGTGLLQPLDGAGISAEPTLLDSFLAGLDLIAASGDKLFGGPQCGLLIGAADLVGCIRKNPLYRTYRVDKLTYAALEATLMDYQAGRETPVGRMLNASPAEILRRCESIACEVHCAELSAEAMPVLSLVGGGAAPTARLQSSAVSLQHATLPPQELLLALRRLDPPVIGRVSEERVLLDLRTVEPEFDASLVLLLRQTAQISNENVDSRNAPLGVKH